MRHFKARRVLFAAGDLDQVARAAHPTGAEIVAEADQRVELPLRGRDVVAVKKVVELGLIRLDLAHQKKLRLLTRDALGIVLGIALRAVTDVPLAAGGILLRAEALFLFDLRNGRVARAHQPIARHRGGHAELHGKAQRQKHGQRRSLSHVLLHLVLSFYRDRAKTPTLYNVFP